jgi:hypothetical protein
MLVNLREEILMNRVRHTVNNDFFYLEKALGFLERYFFLLSFTSYVNSTFLPTMKSSDTADSDVISFGDWLDARPEVWNMMENLRKKGPQLFLFRPVEDLSMFSSVVRSGMGVNELEDVVIRVLPIFHSY